MKRALAILFCLVLVCAPSSPVFSLQAAGPSAACNGCQCSRLSCCSVPVRPTSPTPPASSLSSQSHQEARTVPSTTSVVLYSQADAAEVFVADSASLTRPMLVPLFERTCSWVI